MGFLHDDSEEGDLNKRNLNKKEDGRKEQKGTADGGVGGVMAQMERAESRLLHPSSILDPSTTLTLTLIQAPPSLLYSRPLLLNNVV